MLESLKNKITLGDSFEILKKLPDKCIDLVLTDPPYGISYSSSPHSHSKMTKKSSIIQSEKQILYSDSTVILQLLEISLMI